MDWDAHVERLEHKGEFEKFYRMNLTTFNKLLAILRPRITIDYTRSMNSSPDSSNPTFPEYVVVVGIRWLSGSVYADVTEFVKISITSFYRCRDMFLDAVVEAEALQINWPKDQTELGEIAEDFKDKSDYELLKQCVGAIDGILIHILQPSGVENPRDYFSGHYQTMGLNIQAVCDAHLRFTHFAVGGPGMFILVVMCCYLLLLSLTIIIVDINAPLQVRHPIVMPSETGLFPRL